MDQLQLLEIVAAAKAGDAKGYKALLEEYGPRLFGYFVRSTGNIHDAEDLLGELTFRLVRRLKTYDERGRFDQWLFRIAANMVRDRIRRIRAAPATLSMSVEDQSDRPLADRLAADGPSADGALLASEAQERLAVALEQLDETTRQMVLLRYLGEVSFKELAQLFQCPLGTALARVHRGLKALRQHMGADDGPQ